MVLYVDELIPQIPMKFSPDLLSSPYPRYDAERLKTIADWIQKNVQGRDFTKNIRTRNKIYFKYLEFLEIYERAKTEEGKVKGKTFIKTNRMFYRPRLSNRDDQAVFERLENRRKTSERDRGNVKVSKIRKTI